MTRYAIGDIHGGAKTFRALLERIDLQHDDRLYLLGDYVDRGPDSKGVLDNIIYLTEQGYDIRPLRGNHEDMLISHFNALDLPYPTYMQNWGIKTMRSFGLTTPKDLPDRYKDFLLDLPCLLEDGQFVFVHAGLDMDKENPVTETDQETMLWGDGGFISTNEVPGRIIISGHRMRSIDKIQASLGKPHIQIDNGAFTNQQPEFGHLVALNLETMVLILQPWLDEKTLW